MLTELKQVKYLCGIKVLIDVLKIHCPHPFREKRNTFSKGEGKTASYGSITFRTTKAQN